MDQNGLASREGVRIKRGIWIGAAVAAAAVVVWNYYFFEQLFAAYFVFLMLFVPVLALVFVLVLAEQAGELAIAWTEKSIPMLRRTLKAPLAKPLGDRQRARVRPLALAPRLMRELQKMNKSGIRLPSGRHAA
jgi:hypothetical protein